VGKSFTVCSIVTLARGKHAKIVLVAPTGRAANASPRSPGPRLPTVHGLLELVRLPRIGEATP
jgi:exodeoxyribonuclease V alpha subunit